MAWLPAPVIFWDESNHPISTTELIPLSMVQPMPVQQGTFLTTPSVDQLVSEDTGVGYAG